MSSSPFRFRFLSLALALAALCFVAGSPAAHAATNVITGTIDKVDSAAKTITVKTADGTVKTVKFTDKTTVHGLKDAAKGTDLAGKEGGHVIIHTVGEGTEETAHSVEWFGDKTVHATDGTVEEVGKGSKTIVVKTADGTKETFVVADRATVDTGKDVGRYSAVGAEKGEHVIVYSTEESGKKVAHVFKHIL
jgi:Cu/Ag efflux protein CusF